MRYHRARQEQLGRITIEGSRRGESRDVREALIARARAGGWDVVGHRWLRITRGAVSIEVWFTDIASRVVKARLCAADGQVRDIDIVHNRDRRMSLGAVVAEWLDAPEPGDVRTRRGGRSVSAAHSTEFEAISIPSATRVSRSVPEAARTLDGRRPSTWVRTGLSPA